MKHVRKTVIFNVSSAHQRELYEWIAEQSGNFSGFVKDILFAYKAGGSFIQTNNRQFAAVSGEPATSGGAVYDTDDSAYMSDIL